jgi:hypothetical protein
MHHHLPALEQNNPITESPTMRSLLVKTIIFPTTFKTIRCGCRAQLWGRQASIVIGLSRLAFRQATEGKVRRTKE